MAKCQGCKGDLTDGNSAPSVVARGRGMCNPCSCSNNKKRRVRNPKSFILYRSRDNAREKGIENSLNLTDIPDTPKHCPVFPWIVLEYKVGSERSDGTPSLDRIDNTKGYIKGNVRIISWKANRAKGDSTDQELTALGKDATKRNKTKDLKKQPVEPAVGV